MCVQAIHGGERAPDDAVPAQPLCRVEHLVEARRAAFVRPVHVVQLARPVDAQAHQELVLGEERAPRVVEQRAVRLQIVRDRAPGRQVLRLQLDHALEEWQPHQRRLPAVPGEDDLTRVLRRDVLDDEPLEDLVGDAPRLLLEQLFLAEVVAIRAVEVTERADRLDRDVHRALDARRSDAFSGVEVGLHRFGGGCSGELPRGRFLRRIPCLLQAEPGLGVGGARCVGSARRLAPRLREGAAQGRQGAHGGAELTRVRLAARRRRCGTGPFIHAPEQPLGEHELRVDVLARPRSARHRHLAEHEQHRRERKREKPALRDALEDRGLGKKLVLERAKDGIAPRSASRRRETAAVR